MIDFEGVVRCLAGIAHQWIEPLRGHDAVALRIGIDAVGVAGPLAVDGDDKPNRGAFA